MKNYKKLISLSVLCLTLFSCAGPTSPFGAKEIESVFNLDEVEVQEQMNQKMLSHYQGILDRSPANIEEVLEPGELHRDLDFVKVTFSPDRQNWHDRFNFKIKVRDELGINPNYKLKILYNNLELSEKQYSNFKRTLHSDGKGFTLTYKNFRLPVRLGHDIKAIYWRNEESLPYISQFEEPFCEVKGDSNRIASMGPFSKHYPTFQLIRSIANMKNINPNFIAAMVAKESSFNPKAVSWAKAMGLTQVTPIAAKQLRNSENVRWPVYQDAEKLTYFQLKAAVATGLIHEKNDWRLDKKKSIQGAIYYLNYLEDYWENAKSNGVAYPEDIETDLILASYHSGAARVKGAYQTEGQFWDGHEELQEAKKYYRKIKSYCYSFEHPPGS